MKQNKTKKQKKAKIIFYSILFIICLIAFIIRAIPLQEAHWWDETVYLQNAEVIYSGAENYNEFHFRPPLLPIIFAGAFLIKHHVFSASIAIALLSTLAVLFAALVAKELYNKKTGIIAAILMAFIPFIVENSRYIMTDVPSLSFIMIGFYLLIKKNQKQVRNYLFLSGIFFSLAVLTRFTSLILLFIVPVYFIINKVKWNHLLPITYGFGTGMLPYFVWAQITQGFFMKPFIVAQWMVGGENTTKLFYLSNFIDAFSYAAVFGLIVWTISILIPALSGRSTEKISLNKFVTGLKKHTNKYDLVFLMWIIIFLAYMTLIVEHKELRYLLPITLPVIILSSRGISHFMSWKNKAIRLLAITLIVFFGVMAFTPSFSNLAQPWINTHHTEEMRAADFITENYPPDTILYTNHNYPVFAYYTKMKTVKLEEQDASFYLHFPYNMKEDGILIIYKGLKHPEQEWIDIDPHFSKRKEFENIVIYNYDRDYKEYGRMIENARNTYRTNRTIPLAES